MKDIIPQAHIENKIFVIRGARVMLDSDLADMYGVSTKRLNERVQRNIKRFPIDFMFQLQKKEYEALRSQIATSNRGGRRYLPYVFTEHGVAMVSGVLNSERAIEVNIIIIRAFIKLREMLSLHRELGQKLNQLERKYERHDEQIHYIFDQIRALTEPKEEEDPKLPPIGFKRDEK
ncbi:MAG: ORF6N domain-containing protein [Endomicrobiales bacterium]